MSITLYTTGCPQCKVLESKLSDKNIKFNTNTDIDDMISKGIGSAPVLEVGGERLNFVDAVKAVNAYDGTAEFESYITE